MSKFSVRAGLSSMIIFAVGVGSKVRSSYYNSRTFELLNPGERPVRLASTRLQSQVPVRTVTSGIDEAPPKYEVLFPPEYYDIAPKDSHEAALEWFATRAGTTDFNAAMQEKYGDRLLPDALENLSNQVIVNLNVHQKLQLLASWIDLFNLGQDLHLPGEMDLAACAHWLKWEGYANFSAVNRFRRNPSENIPKWQGEIKTIHASLVSTSGYRKADALQRAAASNRASPPSQIISKDDLPIQQPGHYLLHLPGGRSKWHRRDGRVLAIRVLDAHHGSIFEPEQGVFCFKSLKSLNLGLQRLISPGARLEIA